MIEATEPEQLADLLLELLGLFVGIAPKLRSAVGMGLVDGTNLVVLYAFSSRIEYIVNPAKAG